MCVRDELQRLDGAGEVLHDGVPLLPLLPLPLAGIEGPVAIPQLQMRTVLATGGITSAIFFDLSSRDCYFLPHFIFRQ